jgi:hypothetical protein
MSRAAILVLAVATATMVLTGCGGDGGDGASDAPDTTPAPAPAAAADPEAAAQDLADDLADALVETQEQQGGGSATLTVGDQTWTFGSVLCAIGEDQTGQAGAEFVLSAIQDGLQLYASIDSFGHNVSINDIAEYENPSVALEAGFFETEDFIVLSGKNVTATASFVDTSPGYEFESLEGVDGTLEATCP